MSDQDKIKSLETELCFYKEKSHKLGEALHFIIDYCQFLAPITISAGPAKTIIDTAFKALEAKKNND